jgi:hypothetical protein
MFGLSILVVLVMYVYLAKVAVKFVGRHTTSKLARYGAVALFVLIPTWDILPGQLYHEYLCKTEGGIQVFKTIEIPTTYFLPNGQPDDNKIRDLLLDRVGEPDRNFSKLFHITKYQTVLVDKRTKERLGTATDFWYKGGWLKKTILPDALSTICPEYPNFTVSSSLLREVVRPERNTGRKRCQEPLFELATVC